MHAGPGTLALLLGSGVSRSAGVPTGWEVTNKLVHRLAKLHDEDPGDELLDWYDRRFGRGADYSAVLEELAPRPEERRSLLEDFFVPSKEDAEAGRKVPTPAHHAIADLVASGIVRVILTTNFDRLLERALVDTGVDPVVIASGEAAAGATPLVHSRCTIVKLHGDYLSPNLRNTASELETYEDEIESLLDEILDDYGLVVCGWSAEWDTALRKAFERAPGRRYSTYWCHRSESVSDHAARLIAHRKAVKILISDADEFFGQVASKVRALREAVDQRPLSTQIAVAELKRYLPDERERIRLHDLVMGEIAAMCEQITSDEHLSDPWARPTPNKIDQCLGSYEEATARSVVLIANGAFFGRTTEHDDLWRAALQRVADRRLWDEGVKDWRELHHYPTMLLLYALGLGAFGAGRVEPLAKALTSVRVQSTQGDESIGVGASSWRILQDEKVVFPNGNSLTPFSNHLFERMGGLLEPLLGSADRFADTFDAVEYLLGVLFSSETGRDLGPLGRFAWRERISQAREAVMGHASTLVKVGLFPSKAEFERVRNGYEGFAQKKAAEWS